MGFAALSLKVCVFAIALGLFFDNFVFTPSPSVVQFPFTDTRDTLMAQEGALRAFVVGGTGAVGKEVIKALAKSPRFSNVTLIGRRQVELPTPDEDKSYDKFDEKIVNFDQLDPEDFKGFDVGFLTLGTTKAKSGPAEYYKVDHDYNVNTAKLAKEGGTKHLHIVTCTGANPNSYFLYTKTKGEVEEELKTMDFERLSIYRPSQLLVDSREETRVGETIFRTIIKPLDVFRWISVEVPLLGKVMVANELRQRNGDRVEIFSNKDINVLGKSLKV